MEEAATQVEAEVEVETEVEVDREATKMGTGAPAHKRPGLWSFVRPGRIRSGHPWSSRQLRSGALQGLLRPRSTG